MRHSLYGTPSEFGQQLVLCRLVGDGDARAEVLSQVGGHLPDRIRLHGTRNEDSVLSVVVIHGEFHRNDDSAMLHLDDFDTEPFSLYASLSGNYGITWERVPADLADQYLAGAVLLGAAPCTAMVFVWSYLTKGDAAYTLVQVAVNDLIILVAFAPIVALLLGVGGVAIPWATLLLSVLLFVVIPLAAGIVTRICVVRKRGIDYFNNVFIHKFDKVTIIGLLLTLVILFSFQGETILANPLHILLIAVPLIVQTILIFFVAYGWCRYLKLPHDVAAPAGMIGASNFFELAVAVAISLFGLQSGAALATVVGVLVEVPVMLLLVRIANNTRQYFK